MIDKEFIKERFGISYLRPYQELVITHILESSEGRRDGKVLCSLPTGSGKSLCFMYPIATMKKKSLLVYPLLSLMNDQGERFRKAGIPFTVLRGGLPAEERKDRINKIRKNKEIAVITNPETLIQIERKGELWLFRDTELAVIDEAHTLVTWGESFRESYLALPAILERIKPHLILAFTATMDRRIEKGIINMLFHGEMPYLVRSSTDRENIFYHSVPSLSKIHDAIKILRQEKSRPAVIFCRSRKTAEETAEKLKDFFDTACYHAGLEKQEKEKIEKWFLASHDGVLASTSAYGMGVDKKNIRTVIHLFMPSSVSDYLQESGRGGRDGERMDAYVLFSKNEDTPLTPVFLKGECIRTSLLNAMGETREEKGCFSCSNCIDDDYQRAGETEIIRWVHSHPGKKIDIAAMAMTERRLFQKPRLEGWTEEEAEEAMRILSDEGKIKIILGRAFPKLRFSMRAH